MKKILFHFTADKEEARHIMDEIFVSFNHSKTAFRYIDGEPVSDEEMEKRIDKSANPFVRIDHQEEK